jgi:hypothetical protein
VPQVVQADRLLAPTDQARVLGGDLERAQCVPPAGRLPPQRLEDERVRTDAVESLRGLSLAMGAELASEGRQQRDGRLRRLGLRAGDVERLGLEVDVAPGQRSASLPLALSRTQRPGTRFVP